MSTCLDVRGDAPPERRCGRYSKPNAAELGLGETIRIPCQSGERPQDSHICSTAPLPMAVWYPRHRTPVGLTVQKCSPNNRTNVELKP